MCHAYVRSVSIPPSHPRTSKRARQAAKAEVRKILDERWDAKLLADQFRKAHCEAQRLHALNRVTDPERWRRAMESSAAALVSVKAKLANAVEVLKSTYNDPDAFLALEWDERFWVPPKLLRAWDAMEEHRRELFRRLQAELDESHARFPVVKRTKRDATEQASP